VTEPSLTDFVVETSANVAGANAMTTVGSTLNQIANLFFGPVLWVVMGICIIWPLFLIATKGINQGAGGNQFNFTFRCFSGFLAAAILKGLAAKLWGFG
jgi:hypothetical protein